MDKVYIVEVCIFFECYRTRGIVEPRSPQYRECYVCAAHAARQYKGWYFVQPVVSMCADADRFQVRLFLKYVLSTFFLFFLPFIYESV